ncbi:MAG: primosomal protein N' [Deltaproteobacteria bacterium]|nr:primosomal protein N' [Deltaproteobacteria bacterium]
MPLKDYAEIAVELPVEGTFTYSVPAELKADIRLGKRALVPFGKRTVTGFVLALSCAPPPDVREVRPVIDLLDPEPIFDGRRLEFYRWLSSYYFAPLGEVLSLIQPGGASVRSHRHFSLTEEGRAAQGREGIDGEILALAGRGITHPALLKRLHPRPIHAAVERLKKAGLLMEEVRLKGGGSIKTEQYLSVTAAPAAATLKRSPIQAKIFEYLSKNGETPLRELSREFGNVSQAVRKLSEKGLMEIACRQVMRDPLSEIVPREARFAPNAEQKKAIDEIAASIRKGGYAPYLLYGVTGSGKTLVYLEILEEAVKAGKKAIILAPEIALTPWPAAYLADRFPGRVALAHSGLSEGERFDEWGRIMRGEADIVVGARSALFSPVDGLGLIIVDEEHETSYKQEEGVRYNARDAALSLARFLGITVVLGSATPSVETFHNANTGKLKPLVIKKRVEERGLPKIEIMDMKGKKRAVLSERLIALMDGALKGGHQALLFLNRRGFSSSIVCRDCGQNFQCLNCSVTLTMHKSRRALKCHYCDLTLPIPDECPACKGADLITPGTGTEKVEEEVRALFPGARVGRMDRDTTGRKGSAKKIIEAVEARELDILIGTQMVSKGHHFPGITLVGVVSGDTSLTIPDFRSAERTFQLITQAAGRAGRGEAPGEVVIQTLNPGHYCFSAALTHDYEGFFREEIAIRQEAEYPPFARLCGLRVEGGSEQRAMDAARELGNAADRLLRGKKDIGITVLGPAPALLARVRNRFRFQMLIKGADIKTLHPFVKALKKTFDGKKHAGVTLIVDMDPLTII